MKASASTVYIVDDDPAVRDSMVWLLESAGYTSHSFGDARSFLDDIKTCTNPVTGCLLLDLRLPDMGGLDLLERHPDLGSMLSVVIITGHGDVTAAVRAMKAGALDFIEKPFDEHTLLETVAEAVDTAQRQQHQQQRQQQFQARLQSLTPREHQVMRLVVRGWLNKQIAGNLQLSPKTVEVHRAHVMQKMQAGSLAQLVRMAVQVDEALDEEP